MLFLVDFAKEPLNQIEGLSTRRKQHEGGDEDEDEERHLEMKGPRFLLLSPET
jgi:hypothetical protein